MKLKIRSAAAKAAVLILTAMIAALALTACNNSETGPKQISYINNNRETDPGGTDNTIPEETPEPELSLWEKLEAGEYIDRDTLEAMLDETKQEIERQHQRNLECIEAGFKALREVMPGVSEDNYEPYFLQPYLKFYEEAKNSIDDYGSAISGAASLRFMGGTGATDVTLHEMVKYARIVLEQLKQIEANIG